MVKRKKSCLNASIWSCTVFAWNLMAVILYINWITKSRTYFQHHNFHFSLKNSTQTHFRFSQRISTLANLLLMTFSQEMTLRTWLQLLNSLVSIWKSTVSSNLSSLNSSMTANAATEMLICVVETIVPI